MKLPPWHDLDAPWPAEADRPGVEELDELRWSAAEAVCRELVAEDVVVPRSVAFFLMVWGMAQADRAALLLERPGRAS